MNAFFKKNSKQRGFSLMEILVAIAIFVIGMLALLHLQGSLARSSGDANSRTIAANIAEETIENMRAFSQVTSDGVNVAFNDIVTSEESREVGGVNFVIETRVQDYWYDPDEDIFVDVKPVASVINADMKRVEVEVSWGTTSFAVGDGTSAELGSGSIQISDVISSITSPSGGKVILNASTDELYGPPVGYNPGQNPDIIPIQLGENKFKESTTPLPDVIRQDELVETTFDVVTYSQDNSGALFLRREEFLTVSCECTLKQATEGSEGGRRPTVWDGTEYTEGEYVNKTYGISANNQQSIMCDVCCRDHHDGGTGESDDANDPGRSRFNPFRNSNDYWDEGIFRGDHKHYNRNRFGELTLVTADGGTYVEACRMIRKDGFFRVAQDFHQEGLNSFPENFLDDDGEIAKYSNYVTGAVTAYEADVGATNGYESNPPSFTLPSEMSPAVVFPASSTLNPSFMSSTFATAEQQLRARGIYIDYLSDATRTIINCFDLGGSGETCGAPEATTALEVLPFFDVQLTWLGRWNETPTNLPVDVTNEAVESDNTHTRGVAEVVAGTGPSTIQTEIHSGNVGLTATDPIDPRFDSDLRSYNLYVLANTSTTPPGVGDTVVKGQITSSVGGVRATDVEIESTGAQCDRTTEGFECFIETGANSPTMRVFNYRKRNKTLVACSDVLVRQGSDTSANPWTRFYLPEETTSNANIVIREDTCG